MTFITWEFIQGVQENIADIGDNWFSIFRGLMIVLGYLIPVAIILGVFKLIEWISSFLVSSPLTFWIPVGIWVGIEILHNISEYF